MKKDNSLIQELIDTAPVAYQSLDHQGRLIVVNDQLCQLLEYPQDELLGKEFTSFLTPASQEVFRQHFYNMQKLHVAPQEITLISKSGNEITMLVFCRVEENAQHQFSEAHCILTDISYQKRAEQLLREQNGLLKAIFDTSLDAIVIMDTDGLITAWSKRAEAIFGWSQDEAIGERLENLIVPPSMRLAHARGMARYLASGESRILDTRVEITALHRRGHEFPVELTITKVVVDGEIQFSSFIRDISHRKKIELAEQSRNYVLELLAKGAGLKTILNAIVEGAQSQNSSMICSILLLDREGKHILTGAAPGLPDFYNQAIHGAEIGENRGSCGTAAYKKCRVIVEDIESHPYWADYKALAASANLASCWSEPILSSTGKVLGTFAIYHTVPCVPSDEDIEIIERCASIAGIAIERHLGQEQLELLETSISHLNDILIITTAEPLTQPGPHILFVNDAFERITGYSRAEVINKTPRILQSPKTQRDELDKIRHALESWQPVRAEVLNRTKHGKDIWLELEIVPITDKNGWCTHWVAVERDITERKTAESAIKQLAFYDQLTELPNRSLLLDRLQKAILASNRSQQNGALLFIDLDNFKTLNDTMGHDVGDVLLKQVAQRLSTCVRETDTVARFGGDEFVIMLVELSEISHEAAAHAQNVAEKILSNFTMPFVLGNNDYMTTPSIGITLFNNHLNSIDLLLKRADLAMYQAKAAGKNMMRFFDPEMQDVVSSKAMMESSLRKGLEYRNFLLYYQPQVDENYQVMGFEVLLRWQHATLGLISPADFIPLAEETGLIVPIGLWTIRAACEQLITWSKDPACCEFFLSVNVSARQFKHPDFVEQVLRIVDQTAIDPSKLKLELTESLLVLNVEETITRMSTLKSVGIGFSLDDFGTGYSSLSYLKKLPLDQLKIDRSFVRDVQIDPNDVVIIRTILALGASLGLEVIAEGVENEEQAAMLREMGCMAYQGYLFGKPMPAEMLTDFLNKKKH